MIEQIVKALPRTVKRIEFPITMTAFAKTFSVAKTLAAGGFAWGGTMSQKINGSDADTANGFEKGYERGFDIRMSCVSRG